MTVYYVDPVGGNDSNNGTSFANRKKSGIGLGSTGDEIRWIKSPDPTSLGNGTWTQGSSSVPYASHDDNELPLGGGGGESPLTLEGQASGSVTTAVCTNHGLVTGDVIHIPSSGQSYMFTGFHVITKVDDNNFTLDGTENAPDSNGSTTTVSNAIKVTQHVVKLASSPIKNIMCHGGGDLSGDKDWTIAQGTGGRETSYHIAGYRTARKFKPGNGVTGKVAHVQLDSALDLSGYQQISLKYYWDYCASGQKPDADVFSLRLCSDTGGDTTVHTVPIKPPCGDDTDRWGWYTHDFGVNLNSSIQSIALHADAAMEHSNNEIILNNIIACKASSSADSLHLGSVIGKGTAHMDNWYAIAAILDKIVVIDSSYHSTSTLSAAPPLLETTETVTTYKRECFTAPDYYSNQENYSTDLVNISSDHNQIVSGGWNDTDMSSQDTNAGTWLGLQSSMYSGIWMYRSHNPTVSNFGIVRGYNQIYQDVSQSYSGLLGGTFTNMNCVRGYKVTQIGTKVLFDNCKFTHTYNLFETNAYNRSVVLKNCTFLSTAVNHASCDNGEWSFVNCTFQGIPSGAARLLRDSGNYAVGTGRIEFAKCTFKDLVLAHGEDWNHFMSFNNCTIGPNFTLFESEDLDQGFPQDNRPQFAFINYNNTANDHRLYYTYALVTSDSTQTQSGSGYSWKYTALSETTFRERNKDFPLHFKLAEVAVSANAQVTVTAYGRREYHSENDHVALAALLQYNGSIGLTADAISQSIEEIDGNSDDEWVQLTLTFTPTIAGVATITACMSSIDTDNCVWIDSLSISQA